MIVLSKTQKEAVNQFGRQLFTQNRNGLPSFEAAAQLGVKAIYDEFRQPNGQPAFALVRTYRLSRHDELAPDVQPLIDARSGNFWMALMGTSGDEPAWCDRHQSQGHKAIPIGESQSPMLNAAFEQLGIAFQAGGADKEDTLIFKPAASMTRFFHVEQALGSPYIPAQDGFVRPYSIQSVLGLASSFVSKSFHLTLCFSKTPVNKDDGEKFAELSSFLSTLYAVYDGKGVLWN
jgi:hypothetical protein